MTSEASVCASLPPNLIYSIRELLCRAHVHGTIVLARAYYAGVHPLVLRQDLSEAFFMRLREVGYRPIDD